jgi:hypothetical protein
MTPYSSTIRLGKSCRGVLAGPDFPLNVSQLNSMFMEFGTLMFGRIMTAFADLRRAIEKRFWFSKLRNGDFTSHAQAFSREPNALLLLLCN